MNSVQLIGRLTREVELRFTQSGVAVGTFTLAVNRDFTNQQGEREADFIRCVIWRKSAENFANFTRKGSLVGVEGRIQTRTYDNAQGERVYVTEIVVDQFHLLEPKSVTEQRPREESSTSYNNSFSGNTNFNGSQSQNNSFASQNGNPFNTQNDNLSSSGKSPFEQDFGNFNNQQVSNPFASPTNDNSDEKVDISQDDLPF